MKRVSVVGLPLFTLAKYSGMGRSPVALRRTGLLSSLGAGVSDEGDARIPMLEKDALEGKVKNLEHFKRASKAVLDKVAAIRGADEVICVGGECSFAVGALAGFGRTYKGTPGMLWMDSHGDFNTPETSPSGYIGGMCLAMACGRGPVLGDEIESRRPLLEEGRLIHLGSRALDPPELEMMRASPMGIYTMKKVSLEGTKEVAKRVATRLADSADWIACHLDVDVMDSSIIPAVNYPTRGGMTIDQVASLVKALDKTGKLKVLNVAAYNPDLDGNGSSARAVVEILRKTFAQE
ncbi:MAG: arginase family protein [Nitrososphaerales archaeon]|nr:arginase family protein [Nitrososphaerales archaeon]